MDPLSAVGLASAIVAIIDFSWKLVTGTWEIHQSLDGVTAENARLEDVTGRLESLMQALKADISIKTAAEWNIQRLAKECVEDAEILRALLMEMKAPGRRRSPWESLNAKWKSILNKRVVAQLKARIEESRADIQINLIAMLKEDQSAFGLQITRIEQDCDDLKTGQLRQLKELHAELLNSLEFHGNFIRQQLQDMQRLITTISIQHRILRHLVPDETSSRQDQILEADPGTYRWILESAPFYWDARRTCRQEIAESFISWLRTGRNVLHVSGKPGAGKSTLMKFIGGHPRTLEELKLWAGRRQLVFGQFYFWAAGGEAQRTLQGMLRSLLFQVLSQCPEFIEDVFPRQFVHMKASRFQSDPSVERFQDFGNTQVQKAFDLLLNKIAKSDHSIIFLIDGLNECEGGDLGHEDMAARLKSWTIGGHIKLLVSSRPWRPFLKTFTVYPTLHLHELNRIDIRTYAINQLYQDREICQLGVDRMKTTIEEMVEELVSQAQGIFLWAHLVLDLIRQGIRQQYSVRMLKAKVREYPSDLNDLYNALRRPIEKSPIDRVLSNRMLLLAAAAPKDFPLYALAFSWLPEDEESGLMDPSFPLSTECQPYSMQDVAERLQRVAERVNGLTRGLLELVTVKRREVGLTQQIRFCHRTARDYLITNVKRYSVLEEAWPDFHQSDPYARIYLADLIYSRVSQSSRVQEYLNKPFCRKFSLDTIRKFEKPIQPLLYPRWGKDRRCYFDNSEPGAASFLLYTAYCGLEQFVLYEVANNLGTYPPPPETNILLTSMYSALKERDGICDLTLGLLESCMHRENMFEAEVQVEHYPEDQSVKLPAGTVALLLGLSKILRHCSQALSGWEEKRCVNQSLVKVCRLLSELAMRLGQGMSVTVEVQVRYSRESGGMTSSVDDIQRTFSVATLLDWAERLDPGVLNVQEDEVTEERRTKGWVLDTVPIMLEKNFPGAVSQNYRIASWNLDSATGSMGGEHVRFNYKVL